MLSCNIVLAALVGASIAQSSEPKFVNGGGQHEVKVGEDAIMSCQVANVEDFAVMWQRERGDKLEILTLDQMPLASDIRYEISFDSDTLTYQFTIRSVEPIDSGEYVCSITTEPELHQRHQLIVKVPPHAKIQHDTGIYTLRPGDALSLKCAGTGNPKPQVHWTGPTGDILVKDSLLSIDQVQESNSGVYTCTAANSEGQNQETIKISVQSANADAKDVKPRLTVPVDYVPVLDSEHVTVNISCAYQASPEPNIRWTHNGFRINTRNDVKYREYRSRSAENTLAILEIVDLSSDDLGTYTCQADNHMGNAEATIRVDNKPGPAKFTVDTFSDRVDISVKVSSPTEITEWEIKYLDTASDGEWTNRLVKPNKQQRSVTGSPNSSGDWQAEIPLDNLKPETEYKISVRAKNAQGWGAFPDDFVKARTSRKTSEVPRRQATSGTGAIASNIISIVAALSTVGIRR